MKTFLLTFFALLQTLCVEAQWQQTSLNDQNVYGFLSNGSQLFAGTGSKGISVSGNNGISWDSANTGLTSSGISCFAKNAKGIYAAANGVFASTNNGSSWNPILNGFPNRAVNTLLSLNDTTLLAGTDTGAYITYNNGTQWVPANTGFNGQINALIVRDTILYAGTGNSGVYISSTKSLNWKAMKNGLSTNVVLTLCVNSNKVFAGTDGEGIFVNNIGDTTWSAVNNGIGNKNIYCVYSNGSDLFAGTDQGVFLSKNLGTSWSPVNSGLPDTATVWTFTVHGSYLFAGLRLGPYGVWKRSLSEISTSINESVQTANYFGLYPNPVKGKLSIYLSNGQLKHLSVQVFNLSGQLVYTGDHHAVKENVEIDLSNLQKGLYFILLNNGMKERTQKIVIE